MATTVQTAIAQVRARHAAFNKQHVPDASLARFWTTYQRELIAKGIRRNRDFLAQQMSVFFDVALANRVGTAGAGTTGGFPSTDGTLAAAQLPMGAAGELDVDSATIDVNSTVVSSATATTLTRTAAGWVVDAYAGKVLVIVAGLGVGQRRTIASNTSDTATVTQDWETIPDDSSIFRIVTVSGTAGETAAVVAASPFDSTRQAYLVRLNSSGTAYLDLAEPLIASFKVGITLPPMHYLIGGDVRFADPADTEELILSSFIRRMSSDSPYAAYEQNGKLYLIGDGDDWAEVQSIDLRFVPIAPALTALADYFLLPDDAQMVLEAGAAYHAAMRVNGLEGVPKMDVSAYREERDDAERAWLDSMTNKKRNRRGQIREVW